MIGRDRIVRFADVHPDWLLRTEAEPILEAVAKTVAEPASQTAGARGADATSA